MITDWRRQTAHEMGRTSNHIYLRPHRLLRPYVAHYTVWTAPEIPQFAPPLTLVPDASGCVVLHLDGARMKGCLWGATTQAVTVDGGAQGAPVRIFVEFLQGGLFQFTGIGQSALTNGIFSLADISPGFFSALCRLVESSWSLEDLANGLDELLLPVLLARSAPAAVLAAVYELKKARGLLTAQALSERTHYSARHLRRLLEDYLGIPPKQFARLLRVNAAVRLLDSDLPLTHLAQESGFYDQAHFIRDFREVCGITPSGYREHMSDFYNEPLKF